MLHSRQLCFYRSEDIHASCRTESIFKIGLKSNIHFTPWERSPTWYHYFGSYKDLPTRVKSTKLLSEALQLESTTATIIVVNPNSRHVNIHQQVEKTLVSRANNGQRSWSTSRN